MRKVFIVLLSLLLNFASASAADHTIVAAVDGKSITTKDIRNRSWLVITSTGLPRTEESYQIVHDKVLTILIDEKLISKEAQRLNLKVEPQEIDAAILTLAERNQVPAAQLQNFFASQQVDLKELRKQIFSQILWSKIVSSQIKPQIEVSAAEIAENRASIELIAKNASQVAELKLGEIVLYAQNPKEGMENLKFAHELIERIKDGANFGKLAQQFSQAESARAYGDIGWINSNQLQAEIAKILVKMQPGEVEVLDMPDGVHIIKVLDRKLVSGMTPKVTEEDILQYLSNRKISMAVKAYLKKLRHKTHIQIING